MAVGCLTLHSKGEAFLCSFTHSLMEAREEGAARRPSCFQDSSGIFFKVFHGLADLDDEFSSRIVRQN